MALWGGRFESGPDALFTALNNSLRFDYRLAVQDIDGSIGWAKAIHRAGVLTDDEITRLTATLSQLRAEVLADPALPIADAGRKGVATDEDIHSWVERRLIEKVGPLGKKLHTGRSRNDQVATDLRLWTRAEVDARISELREAGRALLDLAEREQATILPGYTHLQRAQPVAFAHWCLAYFEMLGRDIARFTDARRRVNVCPLGSGALAGTAYTIDRTALAADLGFDAPTVHLSRLGEDLILYGSQEFGFIEFADSVSSGSSLMPQKKNPDAAELLRGKSGRIVGALVSLLTTVKGLPLAYNKDLQEDKEPLFDAMDHLSMCLRVTPVILSTLKVHREACLKAAQGGYANATDLADYLVGKGVPFREAHEQVGRIVRAAIQVGRPLEALALDELRRHAPATGPDVFECLTIQAGMVKREVAGGTGPGAVANAIAAARVSLGQRGTPEYRQST